MKEIAMIEDLSKNIGQNGANELILGSAATGKTLAGGIGRLLNLLDKDLPFMYIARKSDLDNIQRIIKQKGHELQFVSIDELTNEMLSDDKCYLVGVNVWSTDELRKANELLTKLCDKDLSSKKHIITEADALHNSDEELLDSIKGLLKSEIGFTMISQRVSLLGRNDKYISYLDMFDDINIFEPNQYYDYFSMMKKYREENPAREYKEYLLEPNDKELFRNTIRMINLRK